MRADWKEEREGLRRRESGRVFQICGPYVKKRAWAKGREFGARGVQAERIRG